MKILAFLITLLASFGQVTGQVYAIVTVEYTEESSNPLRQFAILLDNDHAPRSVAALMLLGQPEEKFFRNRNATFTLNPAGQYVPANEDGSLLLPSSTVYTISAATPGNSPTTAFVSRQPGTLLATLTRSGQNWTSDNPAISIRKNDDPSVLRYMLETNTEISYFDSTDNYFRNSADSSTNPSGVYSPSLPGGTALPGDAVFTMTATVTNFEITGSVLTRDSDDSEVARFTKQDALWISNNSGYSLSLIQINPSQPPRFILREIVDAVPTLTTGPMYERNDLQLIGGQFPYLSLGKSKAVPNQNNGFVFQNEIVDVNFSSFNNESLWGNRFATNTGLVGSAQRYAVAFANTGIGSPNTAGGEVLITGFGGNPDFDGRHTHIGNVIGFTYNRLSGPPVVASRFIVDQIINGEPAVFTSIEFENRSSVFDPIEYINPLLQEKRLPSASLEERSEPCADFSELPRRIFSGGEPGELRFLERSDDLNFWANIGTAGNPVTANARFGLNVDRPSQAIGNTGELESILEKYPRSFFRTTPMVVDHPQWPAAHFEDSLPNANLSFKGRVDDADNPQILNVFNLFLDSTGKAGTLQGAGGGDLGGTHVLSSVGYNQTGPITGELRLEGDTLPEVVRFRLYFDSHKGGELTNGRNPIERFHRVTTQEIIIGGNPILFEQVSEFGIWVSND